MAAVDEPGSGVLAMLSEPELVGQGSFALAAVAGTGFELPLEFTTEWTSDLCSLLLETEVLSAGCELLLSFPVIEVVFEFLFSTEELAMEFASFSVWACFSVFSSDVTWRDSVTRVA